MGTTDNPITLAQHVVRSTLEPFLRPSGTGILEAALILARVAKELNLTTEVEMAMQRLRR
jgi:pyridoxal/pyridoxine/pyridoxamine kinase